MSVAELRALFDEPRVVLIRASDGQLARNSVVELMRDVDRPRGDMWEVAIWDDPLACDSREVYLTYHVRNEAIVVPVSIDAMRSLAGRRDACRFDRCHEQVAGDHHGVPSRHRTGCRACER